MLSRRPLSLPPTHGTPLLSSLPVAGPVGRERGLRRGVQRRVGARIPVRPSASLSLPAAGVTSDTLRRRNGNGAVSAKMIGGNLSGTDERAAAAAVDRVQDG